MSDKVNTFSLSHWQQYAVVNLGIDAWYLQPLDSRQTRDNTDNERVREHHQIIEQLVDNINKSEEQISQSLEHSATQATKAAPTITTETNIDKSNPINRRASKALPAPIRINVAEIEPPSGNIHFPISVADIAGKPAEKKLEHINSHATELLILPPPERTANQQPEESNHLALTHKEQQLLTEMLSSIGISSESVYQTRLLKSATAFGQDANREMLNEHLGYLAQELNVIKPKRIWLFGRQAGQAILQTTAPLSALIGNNYQLTYHDSEQHAHTAEIVCLPSLDYLLALPVEKAKVWQIIKKLC